MFWFSVVASQLLMMNTYCSRAYLNRTLCRALIVGAISSVGLLSGLIPEVSGKSATITFSSSAYAQTDEATAFAQVVWEVEPTRRKLMGEIQKIVGSKDIPDIVCGRAKTIESLPGAAQPLARQLCSKYDELIQKYKLTPARFQEIARLVGGKPPLDPDLRSRIDKKLIEIQQRQPNK